MAEKEERILIEQENDHCAKCQSYPNCDNCDYWFKSMTRSEAINRMAKGIVSILAVQPGTEPDPWEMWKDYAEAALNALLEE